MFEHAPSAVEALKPTFRKRLPLIVAAVTLVGLFFVPGWGGYQMRLKSWTQDFAHFPLFAAITAFMFLLWHGHRTGPLKKALTVAGIGLGLALAIELIQPLVGRGAALSDFLLGAAGTLAVVTVYLSSKSRSLHGRRWLAACAGLLAAAAIVPFMVIAADWYRAQREFPIVDSFEQPKELGRWYPEGFAVEHVKEHATDGEYALRLEVLPESGEYPSIFLADGRMDWSAYARLSLDVFLEGDKSETLWLRADDKPFPRFPDRAQMPLEIKPGKNTIWVDLDVFTMTSSGRKLDSSRIITFGLFLERPAQGDRLYVDRMYLSGRRRAPVDSTSRL